MTVGLKVKTMTRGWIMTVDAQRPEYGIRYNNNPGPGT
jgi:hypothetical protein